MTTFVGAKRNNPGNIRPSSWTMHQPGYIGAQGGFAVFDTIENGASAMNSLLDKYAAAGRTSLRSIIMHWAPPADHNDTDAYIKNVARSIGVDPDQPLTSGHRPAVMSAMARIEQGHAVDLGGAGQGPIAMVAGPGGAPIHDPNPALNQQIPWASGPGGAPIHAPDTTAAFAPPAAPGAPPGPFSGMAGMQMGAMASNPAHEIQASGPLEAAGAAQQANMNARKMMDFLMPVPADTATSGKPVPNVFGDAATNPAAAEGLFQRLFARPKLAENTGGVRYRA